MYITIQSQTDEGLLWEVPERSQQHDKSIGVAPEQDI